MTGAYVAGDGVTVEVSSAAPDAAVAVWVDITEYARPRWSTERGRQTALQQSDDGRMSIALNNADSRFTSGYTGSPYYPWWKQARKIRIREKVGVKTFDLFTGYIEIPDVVEQLEGVDNVVVVNAVDRLARLNNTGTFVSTVGAAISAGAGQALRLWYPLNDQDAPAQPSRGNGAAVPALSVFEAYAEQPRTLDDKYAFGVDGPPPADDVTGVEFTPEVTPSVDLGVNAFLKVALAEPIVLLPGQTLTVAAWVRPTTPPVLASATGQVVLSLRNDQLDEAGLGILYSGGVHTWDAFFSTAAWGTVFVASGDKSVAADGVPRLVAARYQLAAQQQLWVDDTVHTTSFGGSPPASITFTQLLIGLQFFGRISHVQVYLSDGDADYSQTAHLAQLEVGKTGLARQRSGDRIRQVLRYAGVPDGDMALDPGVAYMQQMRLAGRTPTEVLQEVNETERGRLFCNGSGQIVFHDRRRTYDI